MRLRASAGVDRLSSLPGRGAFVFALVGPFAGCACFMLMALVPDGARGMDFIVHMGPFALGIAYIAGVFPALVAGLLAGATADCTRAWISHGAAALAGFAVTAASHAAISDHAELGPAAAMGAVGAVSAVVSMAVLRWTLRGAIREGRAGSA
jgi:hypothetical protein